MKGERWQEELPFCELSAAGVVDVSLQLGIEREKELGKLQVKASESWHKLLRWTLSMQNVSCGGWDSSSRTSGLGFWSMFGARFEPRARTLLQLPMCV